ncbi:tRNA (N(6)-L-threonylcarbamoyladenosine(37)-C(2))-methylthiotransferase MtaB [Rhizorhabdus dicambivorans]|uniref:tRNA (N(6)-L-threonylcarbamoyladenosine(37)-C(2))-methylthiotransferase MtaB n=1 Tax=Rhizorhabdus dicambivorans TaxID=1850238 RepID=A0A2A4FZE7_9SPHN|nr:tRNA (N(6)-L-threonylcarbamoyladenosine(37)-C(2))-methylthiotransferase MtaB [Rhizorhabdus dicambivorans]ATE63372.1 tRNA (N(6)-L-threonylcarbamoyladenosine(37)-C(2))-methylthiotransferase MtaB [Rhizorhabdus dicambivorans]PCE43588.1 tRNA (N(6)-L-threonylcarbamoyladenosine(37)-C(2))-methylthiotransferase MtaB [Rhizorhabdus dicambivorans]
MSGPELITLGCRLNIAESEAMRDAAGDADDLIIVNSCAVTAEAVKQARKAIRQAARRRPDARIVVTGCAAQTDPAMFAAMPEVARVIGNAEKGRADLLAFERPARADIHVSDIMAVHETAPHMAAAFGNHARAFVEVQNGCDHRCTFCVIPYGRGNSRSVPAGLVIDRIRALVAEGHREVVLTGVDLTSYGPDLPGSPSLGQLVERILAHVPELERLRLSSLDSVEIDDRLFALLTQEARIMPHLHLSLQAGDDLTLKRMKRRHSRAQAVAMVERLKTARPEIAIGADLIAGFPTEDEAMAANSAALIDDCDIVFGHIFPYSPRAGTPAARMPQLDRATIRRRAALLRERAEARRTAWLGTLIGTTQAVLAERGGTGHAPNFAPVRFGGAAPAPGVIADTIITGLDSDGLIGRIS